MTSAKKAADPAGGKTARACDSCVSKRARWYCAADDAFLCQGCDSSVHSANPLARRHERARLKMASCKSFDSAKRELNCCAPSWHKGFTKKARTPRNWKHYSTATTPSNAKSPFHLVPEEGSDDTNSHDESREQLLYRVPILEPFAAELCTTPSSMTSSPIKVETKCSNVNDSRVLLGFNNHRVVHRFLPLDIELSEFAADVESLLGMGLEHQCMGMEELGLVGNKEKDSSREYCLVGDGKLKVEEEERPEVADAATCKVEEDHVEMERESLELSFDYNDDDSPAGCEEVVEEKVALEMTEDANNGGEPREDSQAKRKILLQLDYGAVITAWASQKSPWTTGDKPDFDIDQSWPCCMGSCEMLELHQPYCEFGGLFGSPPAMADGGREARVSRYREKRRTRWFSKKISLMVTFVLFIGTPTWEVHFDPDHGSYHFEGQCTVRVFMFVGCPFAHPVQSYCFSPMSPYDDAMVFKHAQMRDEGILQTYTRGSIARDFQDYVP